jgi:cytochrome b subunit of formate dehydrogenase
MNPSAPTHENNVAGTCGQAGCHPGAIGNFALSGANHLRLKIKQDSLLLGVLWFFRLLIFGTIAFMVLSIALDLIKVVYRSREPPRCGRAAGVFISLSYLCLISTISLVSLDAQGAGWAAAGMAAFVLLALAAYAVRPNRDREPKSPRAYIRMVTSLRLQHLLLMLSVFTLMATGLPLRFASSSEAVQQLKLFGGLEASRLIHRWAAVALIVVAIWHIAYLIARGWKSRWSLKTWRMLPTRKDVRDFVQVMKTYFGLSREEPKFDHYTFRSKIDYLAEYWGVPVMVLSGFILWFPMYFSTRLPEDAWPVAFIAHGYEATLAFLAVVCWHLYNVLFHPNVFPFNPLVFTGRISREEMEREHPLELERLEAADAPAAPVEP